MLLKGLLSSRRARAKPKEDKTSAQTVTKYCGKTEPRGRTPRPFRGLLESLEGGIRVSEAGFKIFHSSALTEVLGTWAAGPFGHFGGCLWHGWVAPNSLTRTENKGRALPVGPQTPHWPGDHLVWFCYFFLALRDFTF